MGSYSYKLAVIITNFSGDILLLKHSPPSDFNNNNNNNNEEEYKRFIDSDLYDIPFTELLERENSNDIKFEIYDDLNKFDIDIALIQVSKQVGFEVARDVNWKVLKCVEEPQFGPGLPIKTVFITGSLGHDIRHSQGQWKWMSIQSCIGYLLEVRPGNDRIGPLVVIGLINDSVQYSKLKLPPALNFQEYPPGVKIVPMGSRTAKPFRTTNLVVFAPDTVSEGSTDGSVFCHGDALIVDPGCWYEDHEKLKEIIDSLPRKLIVFVTHHHHDHVDGLSVVQKNNPDAILFAHENTMARIKKDHWSIGYTSVSGGEEFCIGGQNLRVIFAPGHTDGHMGLLHVSTNSLIVGDHCVGQGSAVLDITSGGNMDEYFQTTYKFMEISPHVLIPMHGRVNLWPKHMLCSYLKNRRARESTILKAIENGANTLFDIVAYTYANVDRMYWYPAASNVRLHVDHLAQQDKLPKGFCIQKFEKSCGLGFLSRFLWSYLSNRYLNPKLMAPSVCGAMALVGFAVLYSVKDRTPSQIKE